MNGMNGIGGATAMSDLEAVGPSGVVLLAAASVAAGAINSVAGGGTILTFPVLAAILPPTTGRMVTANATSTIGLMPGALAAAWAYRAERDGQPPWARWLVPPSVIGAGVGAWLLLTLPPRFFDLLVPWLILLAAVLFALQPRLTRRRDHGAASVSAGGPARGQIALAAILQLGVGVYGGYFGAGIGILMLAVLGLLGLGDIHRLNGIKNVLGFAINAVAAALFATGSAAGGHQVSWSLAAVMVAGSVIGGLGGSVLARRMPAARVRRLVAIIGFGLSGYYLWRQYLA
jgi:uncharacterized membrane protein YfcA